MRDYNGSPLTRNAMELLSLTFVRTGELIAARWDEIDWKNRRWNLPKEHMKMKLRILCRSANRLWRCWNGCTTLVVIQGDFFQTLTAEMEQCPTILF